MKYTAAALLLSAALALPAFAQRPAQTCRDEYEEFIASGDPVCRGNAGAVYEVRHYRCYVNGRRVSDQPDPDYRRFRSCRG